MGNRRIQAGIDKALLQRLEQILDRYVGEGNQLPGAQTLVWRRGELVDFRNIGFRDRENRLPVDDDTIFRIYSMTKPLVSVALMTLFEEGQFQLFYPASEFIPEFRNLRVYCDQDTNTGEISTEKCIREVTLYDLLTHTSGLTYDFMAEHHPVARLYNDTHADRDSLSLEELIHEILKLPLAFQPGTRWHYSVATDMLARVIEVVSGRSIEQYLNERILEPLEMKDTGYYIPHEHLNRLSELYCIENWFDRGMTPEKVEASWLNGAVATRLDSREIRRCQKPHRAFRGGHGLVSTSLDYLKFCRMLLQCGEWKGQRLISPKTVELMTMNHIRPQLLPLEIRGLEILGDGFGLGFGVNIDLAASQNLGSKNSYGWGGLASTGFIIDPREELILIQMAQFIPPPEQLLFKYLRTIVYQALLD